MSSASDERPRRPGRPSAEARHAIDKAVIIETAFEMARELSLQDISIVRVAKALGVAPGLIHYYIGGRDQLTSGVMNLFYRNLLDELPEPGSDWEAALTLGVEAFYDAFVAEPGIARYTISHNRFRTFQITEEGEADYGILVLERFVALVRAAGRPPGETGMYAHLLREFALSCAHATVGHRYPNEHADFLRDKTAELDPAAFPAIHYTLESQLSLDANAAFRQGLMLFLRGLRSGT